MNAISEMTTMVLIKHATAVELHPPLIECGGYVLLSKLLKVLPIRFQMMLPLIEKVPQN